MPHPSLNLEHLRIGPLPWHAILPNGHQVGRDRTSTCDRVLRDGRRDDPVSAALPSVAAAVAFLEREPSRGIPLSQPPAGLPRYQQGDIEA